MNGHFFIFVTLFYAIATLELLPHVYIPSGEIEGIIEKSVTGRTFYSFNGIPYAEPCVGKNKFKAALPRKPWTGLLKANTRYECLQPDVYSPLGGVVQGLEDCLYVNVHTPKLDSNLDVLVYIHGGGFTLGSAEMATPYILMDRDIVFVTINYRLGPFGFLSTENDVLPGNNGLKDQILALKWVRDNIQFFGGNPNSVTITGNSAGGAGVHFHTLSPKSKGLVHRVISSSGSMINSWALSENSLAKTRELAATLGCETADVEKMVDCLSERSSKQILGAVTKFESWLNRALAPYAPVVDYWSSDPVLPEHPLKLLKEKKVHDIPWMLSQMSKEGLCNGLDYYTEDGRKFLDEHWDKLMPSIMYYNSTVKCSDLKTVNEKIRKEYIGDEPLSLQNLNKFLDMISDRLFGSDFDKVLRLHAAAIKSPVYYYWFNYRGAHSYSELFSKSTDNLGTAHSDDHLYLTNYLFDCLTTEEDRAMSKSIVDIYLSFAKNGKPKLEDVNWLPVSKNDKDPIKYLRIDSPSSIGGEEIAELGNRRFWNSLPFEENENLFIDEK